MTSNILTEFVYPLLENNQCSYGKSVTIKCLFQEAIRIHTEMMNDSVYTGNDHNIQILHGIYKIFNPQ